MQHGMDFYFPIIFINYFPVTLQKFQEFWTVLNGPKIAKKNHLEQSPDGLFWTV
jgi:hypothetical protein